MPRPRPRLEALTLVVMLAIFTAAFALSFEFTDRGGIYPRVVASIGMAMILLELGAMTYQTYRRRSELQSGANEVATLLNEIIAISPYVLWLLFYLLLIYLVGLVIGSALFTALFLFLLGRMKPWQAAIGGLCIGLAVFVIADQLSLALPIAIWDPFSLYRNDLRLPF